MHSTPPRIDETKGCTKSGLPWSACSWGRADGSCRIVPAAEVQPSDKVLPNELRPCEVSVRDDGVYEFRETSGPSNFSVYYRGDPALGSAKK
jgi:hypothetical protein